MRHFSACSLRLDAADKAVWSSLTFIALIQGSLKRREIGRADLHKDLHAKRRDLRCQQQYLANCCCAAFRGDWPPRTLTDGHYGLLPRSSLLLCYGALGANQRLDGSDES